VPTSLSSSETKKNRYVSLDILRSACIFYIVGFWHLFDYTTALPGYHNAITYRLTVVVLGLFVLLSGFLIGRKDIKLTRAEVLEFYKNRLLRIYPPYLFALLLFLVFRMATLGSVLKSVFILSEVIGPPLFTLWFIVMLMGYYLLTPVLVALRPTPQKFIFFCLALLAALFALAEILHLSDPRMILYFPPFALGIFLAGPQQLTLSRSLPLLLGAAAAALGLSSLDAGPIESSLLSVPLALTLPLLVFVLMMKLDHRIKPVPLVSQIAYASFFMYLFHRPVYKLVTFVYMPESDLGQILFLLGVCLPLVILLSWVGQKVYDTVLSYVFPARKQG
jgi:peptidoglycan/LPS O-acetylase OafA/YrhL